jgi:uncharacterized membrane protein YhaH (DUF805 family)
VSNRRGLPRERVRDRGDPAGLLWLVSVAVGLLGIPVLALLIDDTNLGVFVVMLAVFGPLFWLLAFRGGRSDRPVSERFRRLGHAMLGAVVVFLLLTVGALVAHNPGWVVAGVMALGALAFATAYGALGVEPSHDAPPSMWRRARRGVMRGGTRPTEPRSDAR